MELTQEQANQVAARVVKELEPATCSVRLFADDDGQYSARVMMQLGDPMKPEIERLTDQLRRLASLVEDERLKVTYQGFLDVTLAHGDAEP